MLAYAFALPGALAIGMSLGLLGSGGSILTVPVLVYLLGQDEKLAIASSLAIVGLISMAGSVPFIRQKLVDWRTVALFGIPGMIGTYLGAYSSAYVSGVLQLSVFALVMLAASYLMLKPLVMVGRSATPRSVTKIGTDGLLVGCITGFVGVGGGFLIVPALVLLGGLSMHRAIATSLVIITLKSFTGFAKYLGVLESEQLSLDVEVILVIATIGVLGSFGGNYIGNRLEQSALRRYFGYFLIVMGAYILWESAPQLLHWQ